MKVGKLVNKMKDADSKITEAQGGLYIKETIWYSLEHSSFPVHVAS